MTIFTPELERAIGVLLAWLNEVPLREVTITLKSGGAPFVAERTFTEADRIALATLEKER